MIDANLTELLDHAINKKLIEKEDKDCVVNRTLKLIGVVAY